MATLSLYIHIPFCLRKCRYCDFHSMPARVQKDGWNFTDIVRRYIDAIGKEWRFYEDRGVLGSSNIRTIYVGGGTPSALSADIWGRLDNVLFSKIDKSKITEWTVECNPESFTAEKARMYAANGVTRLTFGVQSLNPKELSICGRAHSAEKALEALRDARLPELFKSVNVDIMYGLPRQTVDTLYDTLSSVLAISAVKHLSAYELTIAEDTPFGRHSKILPLPADESIAKMYELIGECCAERGMRQYEVSNYALPKFESAHNMAYWSHKPYIGLGASAHSYIHPKRWGNIADISQYISLISAGKSARDFEEILGPRELSAEMIFLGLRNAGGINEDDFANRTGTPFYTDSRKERLLEYVDSGLLKRAAATETAQGANCRPRGGKWLPTSKGMLFADMMARQL